MNMLPREVIVEDHHPVHQQTNSVILHDFLQGMGMLHLQKLLYLLVDFSSYQSDSQAIWKYGNITIQQSFGPTARERIPEGQNISAFKKYSPGFLCLSFIFQQRSGSK